MPVGIHREAIQLANTKIDEIRNGFADWLEAQSPEFKEKLSDLYNRKFTRRFISCAAIHIISVLPVPT